MKNYSIEKIEKNDFDLFIYTNMIKTTHVSLMFGSTSYIIPFIGGFFIYNNKKFESIINITEYMTKYHMQKERKKKINEIIRKDI